MRVPRDHSGQPSIVLRMVGNGERLWDIAKSYGTTAQDIMCANALEEDVAPEGSSCSSHASGKTSPPGKCRAGFGSLRGRGIIYGLSP